MRKNSTTSIDNFSLVGSFSHARAYNFTEAVSLLNCHYDQFLTVIVMEHCDRGSLQQVSAPNLSTRIVCAWLGAVVRFRCAVQKQRMELMRGPPHVHNLPVLRVAALHASALQRRPSTRACSSPARSGARGLHFAHLCEQQGRWRRACAICTRITSSTATSSQVRWLGRARESNGRHLLANLHAELSCLTFVCPGQVTGRHDRPHAGRT